MSNEAAVDMTRLDEMADGDNEFLKELIEIYLEDAVEQMDGMEAALAEQDAHTLERRAHSLKGASANVGAEPLRAISYEMECLGKESRFSDAPPLLQRIRDEFVRVKEHFEKVLSEI